MNRISEVKINEELCLSEFTNIEDGTEVKIKLRFGNDEGEELSLYEDTIIIEKNQIHYNFVIEEIAKKSNFKASNVDNLACGIQITNDKDVPEYKEVYTHQNVPVTEILL